MTDKEIIKDLLRCANKEVSFCKECRHRNYGDSCCIQLMKDATSLIHRLKKENSELKDEIERMNEEELLRFEREREWNEYDDRCE